MLKHGILLVVLVLAFTRVNFAQVTETASDTARTVEHDGAALAYWLSGAHGAPVLVFTHGATMNHSMFAAQVEYFEAEYRILTWDVRGHGLSGPIDDSFTMEQAALDLIAILNAEDIERAIFVGQSMGGYIIQELYRADPDRVQAMIVIGSTQIAAAYSELEIALLGASLPLIETIPFALFKDLTARTTAITADARDYARDALDDISQDEFRSIWGGVQRAISTEGIPDFTIDVPLLLVHGDQDNTGSIKQQMPEWAAGNPNATYHVIPDAGHNANQDNARYFNNLMAEWLRDLDNHRVD
jgi:pimeloyl-ACP methyl ester carboxylesterase